MEHAIETHGLTKKFGDFVAVDHVDLEVKTGEIYGFLGPNGAGKSTTLRMLTTLTSPSSGTAKVAGFDIRTEAVEVRKHIGLVAEKLIMYPRLTAYENLMFFGSLYDIPKDHLEKRVIELLDLVKLTAFKDRSTGGFSTGMRQRLNVVRGIIHNPEILFMDEPTLGLDPQSTNFVRELIKELRDRGHTIMLTTHIMEEVEAVCERISIIDHAKIIATGTAKELKDKCRAETMLEVFLTLTGRDLRDSAAAGQTIRGAVGRI